MKIKLLLLAVFTLFISCQKDDMPTETPVGCDCRKVIYTKMNVINVPVYTYVSTGEWEKVDCELKDSGIMQSNGYTLGSYQFIYGVGYVRWECK